MNIAAWSLTALVLVFFPSLLWAASDGTPTLSIKLEARLTPTEAPIEDGLQWRIFETEVGDNGELPLLATASGGSKTFKMSPGEYFVHVAYGYAGAMRKVIIEEQDEVQIFVLNAGALQLRAFTSPDGPISDRLLRFDIYSENVDERGVRRLIAREIRPMQIVPFAEGTYHIISKYGKLNAETRADLRVQAGKLTQATLQHRAARMTFKLVRRNGDSAIANTSWSILAENGDVLEESTPAFPSFVLTEGNYTAIAHNAEKIYSKDFTVESGLNRDVEVLAE